MSGMLLTKSSTFIIGDISAILGMIMDWMFIALDRVFSIENVGLSIILFTVVVYTLLLPLTIRQQKFMKLSAVMNPEIKKITEKYKGKTDNASRMKMQEETQAVYRKYGSSQMGGCLNSLIQLPILFGLYPVIQNIPAYVGSIKEAYMPLVDKILGNSSNIEAIKKIGAEAPVMLNPENVDYTQSNVIIDVLYKFQSDTWTTLVDAIPSLESVIVETEKVVASFNSFLGLNIANSPYSIIMENLSSNFGLVILAVLVPLLAGASQFLSIRISQSITPSSMDENSQMASTMRTMNITMPLFSVVMCFTFPTGIGIYWITSAVVRTIQQLAINKHLQKIGLDELIRQNREKAEKKGISAEKLNEMAQKNAKKLEDANANSNNNTATSNKMSDKAKVNSSDYSSTNSNAKAGSLADKANMVNRYNKGNDK